MATSQTAPQIPLNFIPFVPSLTDAFDLLKKDIGLNFNCHHVGTIQSFDQSTQTCQATINYPQTYFQLDQTTGLYNPVLVPWPVIYECPCVTITGGKGALTMPITQGDECLILFNDRDFSSWYQGSSGAANPTPRTHSYADAIALVGLKSAGNVLTHYDTARACLRGNSGVVGVNTTTSKILITNATPSGSGGSYTYSTTLNTMLQNLCTQLENLTTALAALTVLPGTFVAGATPVTGVSGVPVNASTISTIGSNITSIATQISGLLE